MEGEQKENSKVSTKDLINHLDLEVQELRERIELLTKAEKDILSFVVHRQEETESNLFNFGVGAICGFVSCLIFVILIYGLSNA